MISAIKFIEYLQRPTISYIIVNIFVSILGFARSFIFMSWLGLEELGLISLAQTVMQFISLFQFGLINGGYRIFSLDLIENQRKVNNTLFTFFLILTFTFIIIWGLIVISGRKIIMNNDLLLVSICCGLLMLINNWLSNTLIGKKKLTEINKINIISYSLSIIAILSIIKFGLWGAILSVVAQPLCFILLTMLRNKDLKPDSLLIDIKIIKHILSFGFIPFLAGIFLMTNLQIERWSIAVFLGEEALGRFYLVFLYNSLFILVPNSIMNIFFPQAVRSYDRGEIKEFNNIIKKQVYIVLIYDLTILLSTILFFDYTISLLFPMHLENTRYVFLFIPGIIAMSFYQVTGLILNASVRLSPILWGGVLSLFSNALFILVLVKTNTMNLDNMACVKSLTLIVPFIVQFTYICYNWNKIKKGSFKEKNHKND